MGEPIEPGKKQHLEDTAAYLVRNPLSLKLVYLDGERCSVSPKYAEGWGVPQEWE